MLSLTDGLQHLFAGLTDVTVANGDTNLIPTNAANKSFPDKLQYDWLKVVARFGTK